MAFGQCNVLSRQYPQFTNSFLFVFLSVFFVYSSGQEATRRHLIHSLYSFLHDFNIIMEKQKNWKLYPADSYFLWDQENVKKKIFIRFFSNSINFYRHTEEGYNCGLKFRCDWIEYRGYRIFIDKCKSIDFSFLFCLLLLEFVKS